MSDSVRKFCSLTQWVEVTRDSKVKTFTFAHGNHGDLMALETHVFPNKYIATWADAEAHARQLLKNIY